MTFEYFVPNTEELLCHFGWRELVRVLIGAD